MKPPSFVSSIILVIPTVCWSSLVSAHDLWLLPPMNDVFADNRIEIKIAVGMDFPISQNAMTTGRLTMIATDGISKVNAFEFTMDQQGRATIASFRPDRSGTWLVGCTTRANRIQLDADSFNRYLLHDGLPHILSQRMIDGELDFPAAEQYSKYTKTMFSVRKSERDESSEIGPMFLGHRLEIVPKQDPRVKRVGETVAVQVLFENKPLAGANVCWDHPGNGELFSGQAWTNLEGNVLVPVAQPGLMTIRLVHMQRPRKEEFEWESFWSSFTFMTTDK